jgi:hypothetical protein
MNAHCVVALNSLELLYVGTNLITARRTASAKTHWKTASTIPTAVHYGLREASLVREGRLEPRNSEAPAVTDWDQIAR